MSEPDNILIYKTDQGDVEVLIEDQNIWLSQHQLSELFGTEVETVSLLLRDIYNDGELKPYATTEHFPVVHKEKGKKVKRLVKHYNLDAIIAVACRINSGTGTLFRQWAAGILKDYLTRGFSINTELVEEHIRELDESLEPFREAKQ